MVAARRMHLAAAHACTPVVQRCPSAAAPALQGNHDNLVTCADEQASPSKALVAQVYQRFFAAKVGPRE